VVTVGVVAVVVIFGAGTAGGVTTVVVTLVAGAGVMVVVAGVMVVVAGVVVCKEQPAVAAGWQVLVTRLNSKSPGHTLAVPGTLAAVQET
jgi:hypothetical protein